MLDIPTIAHSACQSILLFIAAKCVHVSFRPPPVARTPEPEDKLYNKEDEEMKHWNFAMYFKDFMEFLLVGILSLDGILGVVASFAPEEHFRLVCPTVPPTSFLNRGERFWICVSILTFGMAVRLVTFYQLGRQFTFIIMIRKDHRMITDGLYSYVRHPSYSAQMLVHLALCGLMTRAGSPWECYLKDGYFGATFYTCIVWGLIFWFMLFLALTRVPKEERMLKDRFPEYEDYAKRVKRFIPYVI